MSKRMKWVMLWVLAAMIVVAGTAYATLTSKVIFTVQTQYTGTAGLGTSTESLNLDYGISLTSAQADVIYSASRSLVDDANEVLDFYASGTLTDAFGNALTMETLKLLIIYNTSTEASLKIGGGTVATGIFVDPSDILTLPPGGKFLFAAPAITGLDITTSKDLNLLHGGQGTADLTYKVIAIGVD